MPPSFIISVWFLLYFIPNAVLCAGEATNLGWMWQILVVRVLIILLACRKRTLVFWIFFAYLTVVCLLCRLPLIFLSFGQVRNDLGSVRLPFNFIFLSSVEFPPPHSPFFRLGFRVVFHAPVYANFTTFSGRFSFFFISMFGFCHFLFSFPMQFIQVKQFALFIVFNYFLTDSVWNYYLWFA